MAPGKPAKPGASRYDRVASAAPRSAQATWEDADQEQLWRVVQEVTNQGDAIMFSLTRDGGAVVLTVMSGEERIKSYATGAQEIQEKIRLVREAAQAEN